MSPSINPRGPIMAKSIPDIIRPVLAGNFASQPAEEGVLLLDRTGPVPVLHAGIRTEDGTVKNIPLRGKLERAKGDAPTLVSPADGSVADNLTTIDLTFTPATGKTVESFGLVVSDSDTFEPSYLAGRFQSEPFSLNGNTGSLTDAAATLRKIIKRGRSSFAFNGGTLYYKVFIRYTDGSISPYSDATSLVLQDKSVDRLIATDAVLLDSQVLQSITDLQPVNYPGQFTSINGAQSIDPTDGSLLNFGRHERGGSLGTTYAWLDNGLVMHRTVAGQTTTNGVLVTLSKTNHKTLHVSRNGLDVNGTAGGFGLAFYVENGERKAELLLNNGSVGIPLVKDVLLGPGAGEVVSLIDTSLTTKHVTVLEDGELTQYQLTVTEWTMGATATVAVEEIARKALFPTSVTLKAVSPNGRWVIFALPTGPQPGYVINLNEGLTRKAVAIGATINALVAINNSGVRAALKSSLPGNKFYYHDGAANYAYTDVTPSAMPSSACGITTTHANEGFYVAYKDDELLSNILSHVI